MIPLASATQNTNSFLGLDSDILCSIFELLSSDDICTIPPKVLEPPWILGHVCSEWRGLSRSIRKFWKTQIDIHARSSWSDMPVVDFDRQCLEALERAVDLLPPGSPIRLVVLPSPMHKLTFDSIHPNAVLKFLPLINELAWEVPLNPTLFPPGSLEGIEQLSIMPHMSRIVKNGLRSLSSDQFGPSPRLQELKVRSLTPEFIYSGIPWSNLRSLMLDSWNGHPITPELETAWSTLVKGIPINLCNLRELTLESRFELLDVILTAMFPWHQLTSLTIHSEDSFQSCSLLLNPLRQSTNLIKLSITSRRTQDPRQPLHYPEHDLITLPYLQNLRFSSAIPFPMIKHIISSGVLCSLNAERVSVSDLYFLAQQCPQLSDLTALISPSTDHLSSGSSTIIMSSFTHLNITFWLQKKEWSATSFPTLLTTPHLTSLEIYVQACHSVPLHLVTDLISRSHAQLSHFSCRFSYPASVHPSESLLPLLNTLKYATVVDISCVVCSQGVLDLLATGSLLPRLKRLMFTTSDLEQSASTIKSRLLYEESQGNVNLKQIVGYIRTDFVEDADDNGDEHSNSTSTEDAEDKEDDLESTSVVEDVDDGRRKHLNLAEAEIRIKYGIECRLAHMEWNLDSYPVWLPGHDDRSYYPLKAFLL